MTIYYNGQDISDRVDIAAAVSRDVSGGSCDSLAVEFDNAGAWDAWEPKKDDTIEIVLGGYSTGEMYISTVTPQEGKYAIFATAIPSKARQKRSAGYSGMTIGAIMDACSAECGMERTIYGLDEALGYHYLERDDEGCTAFLERIANMEGAVLKCWNGRLVMIGIDAAQKLQAKQTIEITTETPGASYSRRDDIGIASMTVITPYANAAARDASITNGRNIVRCDVPAVDAAQAARWSRGLLLCNNRKSETLTVQSVFNAGWTAMARIDIEGGTQADGEWIVDEVTHDLVNETSEAVMFRCLVTVG